MCIIGIKILQLIFPMFLWFGGVSKDYVFETDLIYSQEQSLLDSLNTRCLDT